MLRKSVSVAMAGLLAVGASIPASQPAEAGRGGRLAAGLALGLAAGAIIASSRRAHAEDHYYVSRPREYYEPNSCQRWAWKCDHGNDWACEKFDRHC